MPILGRPHTHHMHRATRAVVCASRRTSGARCAPINSRGEASFIQGFFPKVSSSIPPEGGAKAIAPCGVHWQKGPWGGVSEHPGSFNTHTYDFPAWQSEIKTSAESEGHKCYKPAGSEYQEHVIRTIAEDDPFCSRYRCRPYGSPISQEAMPSGSHGRRRSAYPRADVCSYRTLIRPSTTWAVWKTARSATPVLSS